MIMFRDTLYLLIITAFLASSCNKFLDTKSEKSLTAPTTLKDFQALLDYEYVFSENYPYIGEVMADNYYITTDDWKALAANVFRPIYTWEVLSTPLDPGWSNVYSKVYSANVVLENIDKVNTDDSLTKNSIKGAALFFRAYSIFKGAQVYTLPFTKDSATTHLGIPVITSADVNTTYTRPSLSEMYKKIIIDLKDASYFLPDMGYPLTRPGKAAVFGTLAYIYLITGDFNQGNQYADSCLAISSKLMNYSNITPGPNPFSRFNDEVIFQARIGSIPFLAPARAKVDSILFNSYSDDDLRKTLFYRKNNDGSHSFQGSYDANPTSAAFFSGVATDEMYLIKAECLARLGRKDEAMTWLNHLLRHRWREGAFVDIIAANAHDALTIILEERRKELAFRGGLRWTDLRRLNTEPDRKTTLKRILDGEEYILPPEDPRYAFLILDLVIKLSGIEQNGR